ncbi:MAG TPA: hypothetical protein VFT84_08560, partial [Gemmatimonadales bacterium]|nr:hypothetical protein [Gemmatimonadales bacterium]
LDPEGSRDAVARGLETLSYRDAIQNAAILATMRRPDSVLVAGLERVAGQQELPVTALAALAGQGYEPAAAALQRLLDDPRPWVRRWARDARAATGAR